MNKFYLILIVSFLSSIDTYSQVERYVCKNEDGYSSDWIMFYDNERFEIVHDEECYDYIDGAGFFKMAKDSIFFDFFKLLDSKKEVIEKESANKKMNITIQVFSLQDSSIINTATIFARDTTREKFDFKENVDFNGLKSFTIPKDKTIKYLRVYANNYIDCAITFPEQYNMDYSIIIYLSQDPLTYKEYSGLISKQEKAVKDLRENIVYNGKFYRKVNK